MKKNKVQFFFSPLGALSTSPYGGFIGKKDGKFYLKKMQFEKFCCYASWEGVSGMRILPYAQWWIEYFTDMFQPFGRERIPNISASITYERAKLPSQKATLRKNRFDLSKFNKDYFRVLRELVKIANLYNITVCFCLFDTCGFHNLGLTKKHIHLNPFYNNVQDVKHFIPGKKWAIKYVDKVLDTLDGLNVMYELCNEYNYVDKQAATEFAIDVFYKFKERGIPGELLSYGACLVPPYNHTILQAELKAGRNIGREDLYGEEGKYKIFRPIHGMCTGKGLDAIWHYFWLSFFISNDGDYWEGDHCDHIKPRPERNRPVAAQLAAVVKACIDNYKYHTDGRLIFEHCPKNFNQSCQVPKLKAMVRVFKDKFGFRPPNWHKYKYKYYEPEVIDVPEPELPPEEEEFIEDWKTCFDKWYLPILDIFGKYWYVLLMIIIVIGVLSL
jgi:hypothetical protein